MVTSSSSGKISICNVNNDENDWYNFTFRNKHTAGGKFDLNRYVARSRG